MSDDFEIGSSSVVIEEVNSSDIPENELNEFETTEPIQVEALITKFVAGETSFPQIYSKDDDDDEELRHIESEESRENIMMSFEAELLQSRRDALKGNLCGTQMTQSNKETKRNFRKRPALMPHLQGLMGEANLQFVRGESETAEKICLEIIRQNPLAPEPLLTLAQIYEEKDPEKCLQLLTIAAHLEKTDKDQWIRVAEEHVVRNDLLHAKCLYSKAIKYIPRDFELRLRRAQLYEQMNDEKSAMYCYYDMLPLVPPTHGGFCLDIAKRVANFLYQKDKKLKALNALRNAYNVARNLFTTEDLNLYLELLIMNENYAPVLSTLRDTADLKIELEQDEGNIIVLSCIIPDNMIPEFRSKLCVSLVHLKATHIFDYFINNVISYIPIEDNGINMFMDIVEALMKEENYSHALELLTPLLERMKTENAEHQPKPYVWLRHADCLRALDKTESAIVSYRNVVELAPSCFDARVTLAALLKKQGSFDEAISALDQDPETESLVPRLLYERCLLFKFIGNLNEYLNVGYLVLLRNSLRLRSREEMLSVLRVKVSHRRQFIQAARESRMEDPEDDRLQFYQSEEILTVDEEYAFLKDLLDTACKLKRYSMAQKVAFAAIMSNSLKQRVKDIETLLIYASIFNNDPQCAFNILRERIAKNPRNNPCWNLFNIIVQLGDEMRYRRFITRLLHRVGNRPQILTLMANYYLSSQSYKYALSGYVSIFKMTNDPLVALLLAVSFSQLSVQKNCVKRPTVATHAIAFLRKYRDLRLCEETKREVYYNMARLFHQLRINHLAIHYYELVLNTPLSELELSNPDRLDLTQEAAFNLHLIYMASENFVMARKVLFDHIVV